MIDLFALVVTHAVLALALLRLVQREDLDQDLPPDTGADEGESEPEPKAKPQLSLHQTKDHLRA
jgi:hypothetical protein